MLEDRRKGLKRRRPDMFWPGGMPHDVAVVPRVQKPRRVAQDVNQVLPRHERLGTHQRLAHEHHLQDGQRAGHRRAVVQKRRAGPFLAHPQKPAPPPPALQDGQNARGRAGSQEHLVRRGQVIAQADASCDAVDRDRPSAVEVLGHLAGKEGRQSAHGAARQVVRLVAAMGGFMDIEHLQDQVAARAPEAADHHVGAFIRSVLLHVALIH